MKNRKTEMSRSTSQLSTVIASCGIVPGCVWLDGEVYFKSGGGAAASSPAGGEPFVMHDFFSAVYECLHIEYRKFYKMDALSKLGFLASELVLGSIDRELLKEDTGIALFNRSASLETDRRYRQTICDKNNFFPSPSEFVYTLPNIVAGEISIRNKIHGETAFYIAPCFRGDRLCEAIDGMIRFAGMKYVLAGWTEVDAFSGKCGCLTVLCEAGNADGSLPDAGKLPLTAGNLEDLYVKYQNY
ncbi:MAG: hypothetical protein LBS79_07090 [Tannerella sp.]|jgi:hypothetical protein|nr:hypothetical protein [Tannerella sp.]